MKSVLPGEGETPIPLPLLKLAAITPFQLLVTTTFDPFLECAINQVRFGGNKKTKVYAFDPNAGGDLPQNLDLAERPIIFHLFGRISALPLSFALTQEDTLEFFYSLQSETRRPNLLFDKLNKESLLIIGSSFGDWLARFFLRAAKRRRLLEVRGKSDYVAEFAANRNQSLVLFLHHFSQSTKMYEGTPAEFVNELSDRWTKLHPLSDSDSQHKADKGLAPSIARGAVFLSYASEDRDVVRAIRDALEAAGIDVFFDKTDLEAGDQWEPKLERYINKCSLFLPIISEFAFVSVGKSCTTCPKQKLLGQASQGANFPNSVPPNSDRRSPRCRQPSKWICKHCAVTQDLSAQTRFIQHFPTLEV